MRAHFKLHNFPSFEWQHRLQQRFRLVVPRIGGLNSTAFSWWWRPIKVSRDGTNESIQAHTARQAITADVVTKVARDWRGTSDGGLVYAARFLPGDWQRVLNVRQSCPVPIAAVTPNNRPRLARDLPPKAD